MTASYSGGQVVCGQFVGKRVTRSRLALAYAQLHRDGELRTGKSELRVEELRDGRIKLVENYVWDDGTTGENVLESIARHT